MRDIIREPHLEVQTEIDLETAFENQLQTKLKKKLKVYHDYTSGRNLIDSSAAYALGLITDEYYKLNENGYCVISTKLLEKLEKEYEIEYVFWDKQLTLEKNYERFFR